MICYYAKRVGDTVFQQRGSQSLIPLEEDQLYIYKTVVS